MAPALVLVSVKVSTEMPFTPIADGANDLVTAGRASTVNVADAPAAGPALVVVTVRRLLRYAPAEGEVTLTVTVHEVAAGTPPPGRATLLPPLAAVTVPAPHVVAPAGVAVLRRPAGYVSVNAAPVMAEAFGLVSVMVSTEATPVPTAAGVNDFATAGWPSTVS